MGRLLTYRRNALETVSIRVFGPLTGVRVEALRAVLRRVARLRPRHLSIDLSDSPTLDSSASLCFCSRSSTPAGMGKVSLSLGFIASLDSFFTSTGSMTSPSSPPMPTTLPPGQTRPRATQQKERCDGPPSATRFWPGRQVLSDKPQRRDSGRLLGWTVY